MCFEYPFQLAATQHDAAKNAKNCATIINGNNHKSVVFILRKLNMFYILCALLFVCVCVCVLLVFSLIFIFVLFLLANASADFGQHLNGNCFLLALAFKLRLICQFKCFARFMSFSM